MIKTALYQLWRPKTLQEIVGQRSVVQTLQNALKLRRLVQAYLFSGPRGSGKTSISRILAKAVNCQSNDQAKPCNQCSNCLSINKGNWVDILEIDAASHRGVDDVRALRDKAAFVPTKGLYKVYIIDEAHMLTTEAANALLKILEEPPAYVLFILATTELHKIPATIASRCQTFSFKRLNISEIVARLTEIVASKDIAAPADALQIIAEHAEGSLRDAIGLLEQALIFSNYKLDQEKTMELLGLLTKTASTNIIQALIKHDLKEVLTLLQAQMTTQGALPEKILQSLISTAKTLLYEQLTTGVEIFPRNKLLYILKNLLVFEAKLRLTTHPEIMLEVLLLGLHQEENHQTIELQTLKERLDNIEKQSKNKAETTWLDKRSLPKKVPLSPLPAETNLNDLYQTTKKVWPKILQSIKKERITVHAWLIAGDVVAVTASNIIVAYKSKIHCETIMKPTNQELVEQTVEKFLGEKKVLHAVMWSDWKNIKDNYLVPSSASTPPQNVSSLEKAISIFGEKIVRTKK